MPRVYVAAPLDSISVATSHADTLRRAGFEVGSRWHAITAPGSSDPRALSVRRAILADNLTDLDSCRFVVADTRFGRPCATFGEIAWALSRGARVLWIQPLEPDGMIRRVNIFDAHPECRTLHGADDLGACARAWFVS